MSQLVILLPSNPRFVQGVTGQSTTTSVAVTMPNNLTVGHLLLATVAYQETGVGGASIPVPTGFTQLGTTQSFNGSVAYNIMAVFYKIVASGDGNSWTFDATAGSGATATGMVVTLSEWFTPSTPPIDVTAQDSGSSTSPTFSAVTTNYASDEVISLVAFDGRSATTAITCTGPANQTAVLGTGASTTDPLGGGLFYTEVSTASTVGPNTGTLSATGPWATFTIALKYAASAGQDMKATVTDSGVLDGTINVLTAGTFTESQKFVSPFLNVLSSAYMTSEEMVYQTVTADLTDNLFSVVSTSSLLNSKPISNMRYDLAETADLVGKMSGNSNSEMLSDMIGLGKVTSSLLADMKSKNILTGLLPVLISQIMMSIETSAGTPSSSLAFALVEEEYFSSIPVGTLQAGLLGQEVTFLTVTGGLSTELLSQTILEGHTFVSFFQTVTSEEYSRGFMNLPCTLEVFSQELLSEEIIASIEGSIDQVSEIVGYSQAQISRQLFLQKTIANVKVVSSISELMVEKETFSGVTIGLVRNDLTSQSFMDGLITSSLYEEMYSTELLFGTNSSYVIVGLFKSASSLEGYISSLIQQEISQQTKLAIHLNVKISSSMTSKELMSALLSSGIVTSVKDTELLVGSIQFITAEVRNVINVRMPVSSKLTATILV